MTRRTMEVAGVARRTVLSVGTLLFTVMACGVAAAQPRTVTLITGDQVTVNDGEQQSVTVIPRKGREKIVFATTHQRIQGQAEMLLVIPADAQPLIDADRLDRKLFNVTALLESNYDDGNRQQLPLVVTYDPQVNTARTASASLAGTAITSTFASVNGVAAQPTKQDLGRFWDTLTGGTATVGASAALSVQNGGIRKIWLDVHYKLSLAESVPQIGAPLAWQSGYDGTGTIVGIIDSGLDTAHPDLVGKMVIGTGFTYPGGTAPQLDQHGHGTHVAGIVTGTGAASGGRYRGVAPGAQLAIFDACDPLINGGVEGCTLSTILEGVHWMAEHGVKIVNMSLGTGDTAEIDPLEEAIQRLSEQYGILYVIAAGNGGQGGSFTIDSPGSTPAALTVGAVDKSDRVTDFSGKGPLPAFGNYLIKPEIVAPGLDITSAGASKGSETGGATYITASGTSMATPHIAGAAAILLQRHPNWSGEQLKSALMGSARILPAAGVFEQGAGRVDVPAAMAAQITSVPNTLSLGFADFPHEDDEIRTRTVTYRNESDVTQSLTLQLDVTGPNGAAPPAGMFALDRTTLSVPAGGTGAVTLTADTRIAAAFGWFSGKLVATAANRTLSIPLALHREEPMYHVSLRHIDRDGADADNYTTMLVPIDRCLAFFPTVSGVTGDVSLRVPVARYAVQTHFKPDLPSDPTTLLLYGDFAVTGASSLTLDARTATLVANTPPTPTSAKLLTRIEYEATTTCGSHTFGLQFGTEGDDAPVYAKYLGAPANHIRAYVGEQWLDAAQADEDYGPAFYAAAFSEPGRLPSGPKTIPAQEMSIVRARYGLTMGSYPIGSLSSFVDVPGPALAFGTGTYTALPLKRTEYYYSADPNVRWQTAMLSGGVNLSAPSVDYQPGLASITRWNEPPFAPALPNYNPEVLWSYRDGDAMTVEVPLLADRRAHAANVQLYGDDEIGRSVLYRNGEKIAETNGSCSSCTPHRVQVPSELASYRIESQVVQQTLPLSTRVSNVWTFQSQHTNAATRLPLITLQYQPSLNENGEAERGAACRVPISVQQLDQQGPARVSALTIEASFDDGVSWQRVPVTRQNRDWVATLQHPADAEYVSLRATVQGMSANTAEITVIRAYALADPEPPAAQ